MNEISPRCHVIYLNPTQSNKVVYNPFQKSFHSFISHSFQMFHKIHVILPSQIADHDVNLLLDDAADKTQKKMTSGEAEVHFIAAFETKLFVFSSI